MKTPVSPSRGGWRLGGAEDEELAVVWEERVQAVEEV